MNAGAPAGPVAVDLPDEAATARLGEDIAAVLRAGDLVALSGGLGVGKSSLARGLVRALAGDPGYDVPSPTFPIRIDHSLPHLAVVHADLYRLGDAADLGELGLDEALEDAALLVEWPEILPDGMAENRLDVALSIAGAGRRAEFAGTGSWPGRLARTAAIRAFLDRAGWPSAHRRKLAGDASSRAYERILAAPPHAPSAWSGQGPFSPLPTPSRMFPTWLSLDGELGNTRVRAERPSSRAARSRVRVAAQRSTAATLTRSLARLDLSRPGRGEREPHAAILMDAPARPEGPLTSSGRSYDAVAHRSRDVKAFVAIDQILRDGGVRAPEIRAVDIDAGLLLLEDLGSEGVVDAEGAPILERYAAAIDLLVAMHGRTWPDEAPLPGGGSYRVPPYDREALLVEISLFPDWFGGQGGEPAFPPAARADFLAAWSDVLRAVEGGPTTWVMRDFHSPNILWQPAAEGTDRVGVIDFQDTLIGSPAYDVASLAQDARVDIAADDEAWLKDRYMTARRAADPRFDAAAFETAYAVLGAQRATKVLGAFTRLALVDGKPGYQRHRARLKALLRRQLTHPVLSGLRLWYEPYL